MEELRMFPTLTTSSLYNIHTWPYSIYIVHYNYKYKYMYICIAQNFRGWKRLQVEIFLQVKWKWCALHTHNHGKTHGSGTHKHFWPYSNIIDKSKIYGNTQGCSKYECQNKCTMNSVNCWLPRTYLAILCLLRCFIVTLGTEKKHNLQNWSWKLVQLTGHS